MPGSHYSLQMLKDSIPDPTLGLHLPLFHVRFGNGPELHCPFRQNMVVYAMNHVWKKKQDVKKHKPRSKSPVSNWKVKHLF